MSLLRGSKRTTLSFVRKNRATPLSLCTSKSKLYIFLQMSDLLRSSLIPLTWRCLVNGGFLMMFTSVVETKGSFCTQPFVHTNSNSSQKTVRFNLWLDCPKPILDYCSCEKTFLVKRSNPVQGNHERERERSGGSYKNSSSA